MTLGVVPLTPDENTPVAPEALAGAKAAVWSGARLSVLAPGGGRSIVPPSAGAGLSLAVGSTDQATVPGPAQGRLFCWIDSNTDRKTLRSARGASRRKLSRSGGDSPAQVWQATSKRLRTRWPCSERTGGDPLSSCVTSFMVHPLGHRSEGPRADHGTTMKR